ncbi:acyltransferase [Massilia sp. KIM]|uniref:acyltransferase family protein n=1 Tax=Massilia sp. KIM TaxID=1955422 RepID=UPI001E40F4C7|nr:acyltransferase [Massilia sp. KIM]
MKAGAAQLIVLHHLAFYGPMADHARVLVPELIDWLHDDARIAVQVFLVVGGFLAARSLSPQGRPLAADPLQALWRRYLKLAPPFIAAMLLASLASSLAGAWMRHDAISAPPTWDQLLAHALLLHDLLGFDALSAGAWYVAIDFQLYACLALLAWLSGRGPAGLASRCLLPALVVGGVAASLLHFNLDAEWDVWAPYFFGSYGLGVLAWWAGDPARRLDTVALLLVALLILPLLALLLGYRSRIAVALVVACLLMLCGRVRSPAVAGRATALVDYLGAISFSIFLVHFPVCLVVNAAFARFVPEWPPLQALGVLLAWAASVGAGAAFHRWVEAPLGRVLAPGAGMRLPAVPGGLSSLVAGGRGNAGLRPPPARSPAGTGKRPAARSTNSRGT